MEVMVIFFFFFFLFSLFFFNDTATTEIYTLSLHDALPICREMLPQSFENSAKGGPQGNFLSGSKSEFLPKPSPLDANFV